MKMDFHFLVVFALLSIFSISRGSIIGSAEVSFQVRMPRHLQQVNSVYISGNIAELGNWRANAIPLQRQQDGSWRANVNIPAQVGFEYKLNLGDWNRVETNDFNADILNRRGKCNDHCEVQIDPENFRITPFHKRPLSATGQIEYFHEVYSSEFNNVRSIAIWLPPDYLRSRNRYPVIYTADGQNVFDVATSSYGSEWRLDETLLSLIQGRRTSPAIVVAIYSTSRREEEYLMNSKYLEFLINKVKPFVDSRYLTLSNRENTYFLGSSFGGVLGLYAGWVTPAVFGKVGALSAGYFWNQLAIERMFRTIRPSRLPVRIWMDMGDSEGGNFVNGPLLLEKAYQALLGASMPESGIHKEIVSGATHSEKSWAARLDRVLYFLLR